MRSPYDHSNRFLNKRLGDILQRSFDREKMVKGEENFHVNVLKLLALKLAILTFKKNLSDLIIHVEVYNKVALVYHLKMGGTYNPQVIKIIKSNGNYLLSHKIIILQSNFQAGWTSEQTGRSRNAANSSDWKLHQNVFWK